MHRTAPAAKNSTAHVPIVLRLRNPGIEFFLILFLKAFLCKYMSLISSSNGKEICVGLYINFLKTGLRNKKIRCSRVKIHIYFGNSTSW